MNKTFNYYCDESCHIEHDHKDYMFLGLVSCAYPQIRRHSKRIDELKKEHNFYAEIKWSKVSMSKVRFYLELIDYFFDTDLKFRAIGIRKSQIECDDYDDFYYKMYYLLLNYKIDTSDRYNVYIDIKDSLSAQKVRRLKEILNTRYGVFRNVQNICSNESLLMQMADFITGAISYNMNDKEHRNVAKMMVIEHIMRHLHTQNLDMASRSEKSDLFFINLQ